MGESVRQPDVVSSFDAALAAYVDAALLAAWPEANGDVDAAAGMAARRLLREDACLRLGIPERDWPTDDGREDGA